ncbi:hypothetical protein AB0M54_24325 [Actinoplanes sp. NPDC051470]|uniref:hypothetical protein n=1 Tax=Actinoplanes sp. NPDC051470 TaxID=3157224 RepID=UPI0034193585
MAAIAICKRAGCDVEAYGTVLTQGEYSKAEGGNPERVEDWCRPHHVEERRLAGRIVAVELLSNRYKVTDVNGETKKQRGDIVEWDADETDVDLNCSLPGLGKRLDAPSVAEALAAEEEALLARLADTQARRAQAEKAAADEAQEAQDAQPELATGGVVTEPVLGGVTRGQDEAHVSAKRAPKA